MATFTERISELYELMRDGDHTIGRKKFSEILGVKKTQVDGWLDSGGTPNLETIKGIAKTTGIHILWLIGESNEKECPQFETTGLSSDQKEDYDLLMEFLLFKQQRKIWREKHANCPTPEEKEESESSVDA